MNFPVLCSLPFSHSTILAAATAWPAPGRCLCIGSYELAVSLWAEHCLLLYSHRPMPGTYSRCSVNVCWNVLTLTPTSITIRACAGCREHLSRPTSSILDHFSSSPILLPAHKPSALSCLFPYYLLIEEKSEHIKDLAFFSSLSCFHLHLWPDAEWDRPAGKNLLSPGRWGTVFRTTLPSLYTPSSQHFLTKQYMPIGGD